MSWILRILGRNQRCTATRLEIQWVNMNPHDVILHHNSYFLDIFNFLNGTYKYLKLVFYKLV